MLDSHPLIVGIGEDSVFNGNLIEFRDKLVAISSTGDSKKQLKQEKKLIHTYANRTIAEMYKYVNKSQSQTEVSTIKHVVDKMLFNYKNIGKNLHSRVRHFFTMDLYRLYTYDLPKCCNSAYNS